MKVTRIMHASVNVSGDLKEADRFYADVLGLASATRPDIPGVGGRWFSAGGAQVHLVDAASRGSGIDPTGPHFCLGVEDMDAAVAELEERGIECVGVTTEGVRQIWFCDPAGNTVEMQQDRPL